MIVDSMTYEEVVGAYIKEYREVQKKCCSIIAQNLSEYKRTIFSRSRSGPIFFRPVEIKSSSGNDYYMQAFAYDKASFKKTGMRYYSFLSYYNKKGMTVVTDTSLNRVTKEYYAIFISHFFERYRERFVKDSSIGIKDSVFSYFKANQGGAFTPVPSDKYKDSYYCAVNDGVALGSKINDTILLVKTFITYDMLRGEQVGIGEDLGSSLVSFFDSCINRGLL